MIAAPPPSHISGEDYRAAAASDDLTGYEEVEKAVVPYGLPVLDEGHDEDLPEAGLPEEAAPEPQMPQFPIGPQEAAEIPMVDLTQEPDPAEEAEREEEKRETVDAPGITAPSKITPFADPEKTPGVQEQQLEHWTDKPKPEEELHEYIAPEPREEDVGTGERRVPEEVADYGVEEDVERLREQEEVPDLMPSGPDFTGLDPNLLPAGMPGIETGAGEAYTRPSTGPAMATPVVPPQFHRTGRAEASQLQTIASQQNILADLRRRQGDPPKPIAGVLQGRVDPRPTPVTPPPDPYRFLRRRRKDPPLPPISDLGDEKDQPVAMTVQEEEQRRTDPPPLPPISHGEEEDEKKEPVSVSEERSGKRDPPPLPPISSSASSRPWGVGDEKEQERKKPDPPLPPTIRFEDPHKDPTPPIPPLTDKPLPPYPDIKFPRKKSRVHPPPLPPTSTRTSRTSTDWGVGDEKEQERKGLSSAPTIPGGLPRIPEIPKPPESASTEDKSRYYRKLSRLGFNVPKPEPEPGKSVDLVKKRRDRIVRQGPRQPIIVQGHQGHAGAGAAAGGAGGSGAGGAGGGRGVREDPRTRQMLQATLAALQRQKQDGAKRRLTRQSQKQQTVARRKYASLRKEKLKAISAKQRAALKQITAHVKTLPKKERASKGKALRAQIRAKFKKMKEQLPASKGKSLGEIATLAKNAKILRI
jgi:hypothetical protein